MGDGFLPSDKALHGRRAFNDFQSSTSMNLLTTAEVDGLNRPGFSFPSSPASAHLCLRTPNGRYQVDTLLHLQPRRANPLASLPAGGQQASTIHLTDFCISLHDTMLHASTTHLGLIDIYSPLAQKVPLIQPPRSSHLPCPLLEPFALAMNSGAVAGLPQ